MALKRIILPIFFLILLNLHLQAQPCSSSRARVSASIIHPVGTGSTENLVAAHLQPGPSAGEVELNRGLLQLSGTNRLLLQETRDKKIIQVVSNGAVFDITVNYDPLIFDNDKEIRIESISPVLLSRNKFTLNTKLRVEPGYTASLGLLRVNCDVIIHFN